MKMKPFSFERVFLIVMDSVGIGEAPDAASYGDTGADTLGHIAAHLGGIHLPHLERLGLGNIKQFAGVRPRTEPFGHYGKMQEASIGKDTMTGHWELMGLRIDRPFLTFPNGFPDALIQELEEKTGRKVIGNKSASGTEILDELGADHIATGNIIVYTSADSVLQIAAHEDIVPLEELYQICSTAREMTLREEYAIGRVIARPFIGKPGAWERTANRHDYALKPFNRTVMNELQDKGLDCIALGKISDIFDGEGVTNSIRTNSNMDGMDKLLDCIRDDFTGLCFLNLVDFDANYGHRRDPLGYGKALMDFDKRVEEVLGIMRQDDLLIITADHGNDPTHPGTDHTREYVPLICYHKDIQRGIDLGVRLTFSDIGATIAHNFQVPLPEHGVSFLQNMTIRE